VFTTSFGGADDDEVINDRIEQLADLLDEREPRYRWWLKRRLIFLDRNDATVDVTEDEGLLYAGFDYQVKDVVSIYAQRNRLVNKATYPDTKPQLPQWDVASETLLTLEDPAALVENIVAGAHAFFRTHDIRLPVSWSDLLR
jgi:hypothetical protein